MSFLNKLFRLSNVFDAAQIGDLARVRALVQRHPQLVFRKDEHGLTPLHRAADAGPESMAAYLLANQAEAAAELAPHG